MIDLMNVSAYRENNRIEAKKAMGGLPKSIWETYSAFANALGGVILLGVEENMKDHTLHPVDLPDPQRLVQEFWTLLHSGKTVSVDILTEESVRVVEVDGGDVIAIEVPRARRSQRPVYIGGDPMMGTYRRNGEGDYRCSREEVQEMLRDAARQTPDMAVLMDLDIGALDAESICAYRACLSETGDETTEAFLCRIGAAAEKDGALHPTVAGLLMFGRTETIRGAFPYFELGYHGIAEEDADGSVSVRFAAGENVFDFYTRVSGLLYDAYAEPVYPALREALLNCLLNADYHGRGGVSVRCTEDAVEFSNPGQFRIDVAAARSGGVSDPRNLAMTRMFEAIGAVRGAGRGLAGIMALWQERGWETPSIRETFDPTRVTLRLSMKPAESAAVPELPATVARDLLRSAVIADVTEHVRVTAEEVAARLGADADTVQNCLQRLIREEILTEDEPGICRLKI